MCGRSFGANRLSLLFLIGWLMRSIANALGCLLSLLLYLTLSCFIFSLAVVILRSFRITSLGKYSYQGASVFCNYDFDVSECSFIKFMCG
jgi:hypothetical protein